MKKKELKTLDVNDLEADYDKSLLEDDDETIDDSVNVNDLDLPMRISSQPKSRKLINKIDPQAHAQRKKLNTLKGKKLLNHMTTRYRFDRAKHVWWAWGIIIFVLCLGYFAKPIPVSSGGDDSIFFIIAQLGTSIANMLLKLFGNVYYFIALGVFFFVPLKRNTPTMVEVYYDGLTIPNEVIPLGKHMRKRVSWRQIKLVKFKKKRGIPLMQLYAKDKSLLGEVRLDVDDVATMYKCLETYVPAEHPVRVLFENKKS